MTQGVGVALVDCEGELLLERVTETVAVLEEERLMDIVGLLLRLGLPVYEEETEVDEDALGEINT